MLRKSAASKQNFRPRVGQAPLNLSALEEAAELSKK
jgi:hypothetical protein